MKTMLHAGHAHKGAKARTAVPRSHLGRRISCFAAAEPATAHPPSIQRKDVDGVGRKHVIVVGGGIGGLVSAAKLAKAGLKVTLLEQGSQVGGRCQTQHVNTELGTFRIDTGPSLLLFPHVYKQTFQDLGVQMEDYVSIQRVDPAAYRVWYEGNTQLDMLYNVPDMMSQLEAIEPGAGRAYLQWLAQARTALEVGTRNFIERDFDSLWDFLDLRRLLPLLGQVDLFELLGQHNARLKQKFKDPRIRALFTFQDLYVGLTPYKAPGVFSLLAATEITDGVFYPMGGFQQVKDALAQIAVQLGVEIHTNTQVTSITTDSSTASRSASLRATGVVLSSGQSMSADVVLSNRDVPLTYELLSNTSYGAQQCQTILAKQYSASVIAYNFCVKGRLDRLAHHNVFLSGDYERSWQRATSAQTLLPRPNFYVHCPSRTDPTAAPPGHDSVMVLLPVANLQQMAKARQSSAVSVDQQDSWYSELVQAGRDAITRTFKADGICEDLQAQVVHEFVIDPVEWQNRYSIGHGAVFGLAHGLDQLAYFRPPVKDPQVQGLYLVGASARPGNGVPLVMLSADLAVKRVLKDMAVNKQTYSAS